MNKLDETIAQVAYILDNLMVLRNIYETGNCNDCRNVGCCEWAPKPGQMLRYNCPFYINKDGKKFSDTDLRN